MFLLVYLLLISQTSITSAEPLWNPSDVLIEDSLGTNPNFAADYNYSNGNIYVACIPDSGTYFGPDSMGILLFRSTNHGETWDTIFRDAYEAQYWEVKEIDLVVTRDDTVYVLMSWYHEIPGNDQMNIAKIWEAGGFWNIDWLLSSAIDATEIRSPKLVRDDFEDFYLYMSYLDITAGYDTLHILVSGNGGNSWDILVKAGSAANWLDQDITTADSSLYHLSILQSGSNYTLQLSYWRDRGNPATSTVKNPLWLNTGEIQYPRLGVTTTLPDTTQLVYVFYSRENLLSGEHNLLYLYSEEGGDDWPNSPLAPGTVIPDTLVKGSLEEIYSDIRGYQVTPNQYMNIAYCFTTFDVPFPTYQNVWRWSSESDPTNWHEASTVGEGTNISVTELVYSPGAPATGSGVVYNDSYGNLWFDAPWRESGIAENPNENITEIRNRIALAGGMVEVGSSKAIVYDVTGREIIKLNTGSWNLKDKNGKEVEAGIYFIIDKNSNKIKLSVIK